MPFILKLEDIAKGTQINSFYLKYRSYLGYDIEKIKEIQRKKLLLLIEHAARNIPWYEKQMTLSGVNFKDIAAIDDIKMLPILSRDEIQENLDQLLWNGYKGKVFKGSSSGTTGIPIKYFKDVSATSAGTAAGHILKGLSGWIPGMPSVHIWGNSESIKQWNTIFSIIKQRVYSRMNISSSRLNDSEQLKNIVEKISKHNPKVIDGYTNSIYELATYLSRNSITIPTVKMVFTTAENFENHHLKLIESSIAPVSDLYGCSEINGIACKPINDDKYFIFDPHVIVETINSAISGMKEILVTDLDNYYMPLIRYRIGDFIDDIYPASSSNAFPFSYFSNIYGRTSDYVVLPNGKKIFPVNIFGGTLYRKYSAIKRHKTIWNGEKLIFVFEVKGDIDLEMLNKEIMQSLSSYGVSYEIKITEKLLPSGNGKFKYFEKI
jgi:phenylacetate-CoA ligase